MNSTNNTVSLETLTSLCKRRGFVFQSSEIYGGINGFWDYGPLGIQLKNNIRDEWWKAMVECPPLGPDGDPLQIVGLDSSIIQNPQTWVASGHVGGFSDPMVDCKATKNRYRADQCWVVAFESSEAGEEGHHLRLEVAVEADAKEVAIETAREKLSKKEKKSLGDNPAAVAYTQMDLPDGWPRLSPATQENTLTEPREFNLMFETYVGAIKNDESKAYLRPETAQGIFLNYKNVVDTSRVKVPFGIAQIGKAFRNEVTPRNFIFRSREFEQMEMEWFCHPDESQKWFNFWKEERMKWWESLGIEPENLRFRDHDADELAHYSNACVDVEYRYPFTAPDFGELEGIAHRGCFDLTQHQEASRQKLEYLEAETGNRYLPNVIEPASGLTRAVLVILCEAYREEWVPKDGVEGGPIAAEPGQPTPEGYESRVVMKFLPKLAPVKVAVFPLLKNRPELVVKAREIYYMLRPKWTTFYDQAGAIGRRYRRQDEVGTPYCVTVDFDSLQDDTVTIRDRDTMEQVRVPINELETVLAERLG
ncbi:MAG: glycine--tRNA ligase [Verrucomicrobia bacterium]|nr:glycine--tRNA ligase [Verrucomicrobiota bacterium]